MMKFALLIVAALLMSCSPALAANGTPKQPQRVAPTVTHPWSNSVCSGFAIDSNGQAVCKHGPAWGSPVYGCPKGYTLTLLLSNKWTCER